MTFGQRLRSRFWRPRVDDEVDAEFAFHVEMRIRQLVERGMRPDAAREEAVRRFGDINRVNARCRALGKQRDHEMRRTEYMTELRQDVTFAVRQLLRSPGFTLAAVVTLALGIGATTAIFSAVKSVVLQPLPFPAPERIIALYEDLRGNRSSLSAGNFVDGIEPVQAFAATAAMQFSSFNMSGHGDAQRVVGARVTAGFFRVFDMAPERGRVFTAEEDRPGREQVVVLSHRLWRDRFASDPAVVGRQITLNERAYDVIGVMPARFNYTADGEELWVPIAFTPERRAMHDEHYLVTYARLAPDATLAAAAGELARHAERLRTSFPRENADLQFATTPALADLVGDYPGRMFTLLGAVGFVLLIACANVANLLLARGAARANEIAVRAALGAGRARLARQLLTESVVLALAAAGAGLALAAFAIQALVAAAPPGVPRLEQTAIDPTVLGFTLLLALGSVVVFGLAPAMRASRTDVQFALRHGGRSAGMGALRDGLRTTMIAAELAVALVLLVGAGLLIRSSMALQRTPSGFNPAGVLSARLALPAASYADRPAVVNVLEQLAASARTIPGVTGAGITTQVPMGPGGNGNGLLREGLAFEGKNLISSRLRIVTPEYFAAMGIPIVKGRALTADDRRGGQLVMVISESLARAAFPGEDPIGRRIACCESGADGKSPSFKIVVGVAGDVRWRGPAEAPTPEFYLPIDQVPEAAWEWVQRTAYIVVRTDLDPRAMADPLARVVREHAPGVPVFQVRTMEERLQGAMATARFNTMLLTLLGGIGLALASIGIYGVVAYFVARRTQEIGVRVALGATRRDVMTLVLRQAAKPFAIGIGAGLGLSLLLSRLLSTQLVAVTAHDPLTFAAVVATLVAVALVAGLIPARRAASIDPTRALQSN